MQAVFGNKKYVILYSIIIGLALILTYSYLRPQVLWNPIRYDAAYYADLSLFSADLFGDDLRNLGYPAFLYTIRTLTLDIFPGTWLDSVRFIQFLFHIVTAFTCVAIFDQMKPVSSHLRLLVFACIALNPLLLNQTQEIVTETSSTFLLSTAVLLMLTFKPFTWLYAGFAFGLLILVRPFHSQHTLTLLIVTALWIVIVKRKQLTQLPIRATSISIIALIVALGLPLMLQAYSNYMTFDKFTLGKPTDSYWRAIHFEQGQFIYKYETYVAGEFEEGGRYYYASNRITYVRSQDDPKNIVANFFNDIIGSTQFYLVKLTGIFQNFEWSTYRQNTDITAFHPAMILGYFHFLTFLYLIQNFLFSLPKLISKGFVIFPFVWFAIMIQVAAFWLVFVTESRFIVQVIPLMMILVIYRFSEDNNRKYTIVTAIIALILYVYTFNTLALAAPQ